MPLDEIKRILDRPDFDGSLALANHLSQLLAKQRQLEQLIANVRKTIKAAKGEIVMTNDEKFRGFVQKLVEDNEQKYGQEIRAKYGSHQVDQTNAKIKGMSAQQYAEIERLSLEINNTLKAAFEAGDPASPLAQKACQLHKEWLCYFWSEYSKEAHLGLAQGYVDDPRFTAYYDKIAVGCAPFLRDAIFIYCK